MKIGINATCFDHRPTGATQRFKGLYRELFKRLSNTQFVVFEPCNCNMDLWFPKYDNVSFKRTPLSSCDRAYKFLRGLLFWPSTLRRERCDIFEAFNMPFTRSPIGQTVMTIHDIRNAYDSGPSRFAYKRVLDASVRNCDHIITVSQAMRTEILSFYPNLSVSVAYNGIDAARFQTVSPSRLCSLKDKYNLPKEFILSVGHCEARKNYTSLVTGIAWLREKKRGVHLVIVGNDNGGLVRLRRHINSLDVGAYVTILSGLSDLEVSCIYKLASLFVFASSYEGFGIPVLESMAARCPIVLSDIPVFRELTQGQGVYFPHNDPAAIGDAIDSTLSSSSIRDRLIQYGEKRVQNFSFQKVSMVLESIYSTLC